LSAATETTTLLWSLFAITASDADALSELAPAEAAGLSTFSEPVAELESEHPTVI
jgi:hypothetical protein